METATLSEKELNEEILIDLARKNSQNFRPLYEKYYKIIFRFIYHKVLDKDATADITSNTFVKAMTNLDKFSYRSLPFSAWLYRIAYNEVMQYFRKEKKDRKVVVNEEVLLLLSDDSDDGDMENIKRKFNIVFQILDLNELEFIQLRFYEGLTFQEIGTILGITENYAKVKTHRILEKIRHKYKLI